MKSIGRKYLTLAVIAIVLFVVFYYGIFDSSSWEMSSWEMLVVSFIFSYFLMAGFLFFLNSTQKDDYKKKTFFRWLSWLIGFFGCESALVDEIIEMPEINLEVIRLLIVELEKHSSSFASIVKWLIGSLLSVLIAFLALVGSIVIFGTDLSFSVLPAEYRYETLNEFIDIAYRVFIRFPDSIWLLFILIAILYFRTFFARKTLPILRDVEYKLAAICNSDQKQSL